MTMYQDAVKTDSRICFAIAWFDDEKLAEEWGEKIKAGGATYNGGWHHGEACGREKGRDYITKDGVKLYAVTY